MAVGSLPVHRLSGAVWGSRNYSIAQWIFKETMSRQDVLRIKLADGPSNEWDIASIDWTEINQESVVVEIGGYKGRWAKLMADLYHPKLYVFEPQPWAFAICNEVLAGTGARVYDVALGTRSEFVTLGDYGRDGASLLKTDHNDKINVGIIDTKKAFDELGLDAIDLCLINIEGYEYTLIPYMAECGLLRRIKIIMVQFHTFAANSVQHQATIALLNTDHDLLWNYGAMLSAWRLHD